MCVVVVVVVAEKRKVAAPTRAADSDDETSDNSDDDGEPSDNDDDENERRVCGICSFVIEEGYDIAMCNSVVSGRICYAPVHTSKQCFRRTQSRHTKVRCMECFLAESGPTDSADELVAL